MKEVEVGPIEEVQQKKKNIFSDTLIELCNFLSFFQKGRFFLKLKAKIAFFFWLLKILPLVQKL